MAETIRLNQPSHGSSSDRTDERSDGTLRLVPGEQKKHSVNPRETIRLTPGQGSKDFGSFRRERVLNRTLQLNGREFAVKKIISEGKTGEADIYLVKDAREDEYIFKKYKRDIQVKPDVLETVKGLDHPHVIKVIDYGFYEECFFELMEYARGGTVEDYAPIRNISVFKEIVRQTCGALAFCHEKGLVHRDIKPENLFVKNRDGSHILVADFGIASMVDVELERKVTSRNLTFQYAAPETLTFTVDSKVTIGPPVDYFALGLTLITLWSGSNWYEDIPFGALPTIIVQGDVDIPEEMPNELSTVIKGFLAHNPADRWTNNEVRRWLNGERVPVAQVSMSVEKSLDPYDFIEVNGERLRARDMKEMAELMFTYPEQGIRHLYRGDVVDWIKPVDRLLAMELDTVIEEEYPKEKENPKFGLLKAIYLLDPERGFISSEWEALLSGDFEKGEELLDAIGDKLEDDAIIIENGEVRYSEKVADIYVKQPWLKIFLEVNGQKAVWERIESLAGFDSSKKSLCKLILLLQKGDTFRFEGKDYNFFADLRNAGERVQRLLAREIHSTDSKFLCWLEEMYLKSDSRDVSECEIVELISLIREMPWLKKYDKALQARLNRRDETGWTDLMKVAAAGDLDSCKELIESGADLNRVADDGNTPFAAAALNERLDIMDYLIGKGAEINPVNSEGSPLIHELVMAGRKSGVSFLIEHGVSPNTLRESDRWTPLTVAVKIGERTITSMLLNAGANPNILDSRELAPLHSAAGDNDPQVIEMLIKKGARINVGDDDEFTPLHLAARDNCPDAVRKLIELGAVVNICKESNWTPLHTCAEMNTFETAKILLKAGATPDIGVNQFDQYVDVDTMISEKKFYPPLVYALTFGHFKMAGLLLDYNASVFYSELGRGYLHIVRELYEEHPKECMEIAKRLLEVGCDPNQGGLHLRENDYPEESLPVSPVLAYAVWNDQVEFAELLLEYRADPNVSFNGFPLLYYAASHCQDKITELLLQFHADPNCVTDDNQSPLHGALYSEDNTEEEKKRTVELLLQYGANPYLNDELEGNNRYNPFCYAAHMGSPEIVGLFIKYGADARKAVDNDKYRQTPFFWAIANNRKENLKLLAEARKGIDKKDIDGFTPLMLAAYRGDEDAVEILLRNGANPKIRSRRGYTAAEIAAHNGQTKLAEYLIRETRIRPFPIKIACILFKVLAATAAFYTFLWATAQNYFISGEVSFLYKLIFPAAAANAVFWYLFASRIGIIENIAGRGTFRAVIRVGIVGILVAVFIELPNFIRSLPLIGGRFQLDFYDRIPIYLLEHHVWTVFHPESANKVFTLLKNVPVIGSFSGFLLIITLIVLVVILLASRMFHKKLEKAREIVNSV
jgi:ankyrin repeat protein/serine/threonine protein kinase